MENSFNEYMQIKRLSDQTKYLYNRYHQNFFSRYDIIDKENVFEFLNLYNNNVCRAFLNTLLEFNEIYDIRLPKVTGRKKQKILKYISETEVILISKQLRNLEYKIMLYLSFYLGLRRQELLKLRPLDFNWKKWDLNKSQVGEVLLHGKGNKEGIGYVPPKLMRLVRNYINNHAYHNIPTNTPFIKISKSGWYNELLRASKKAIGKHVHPHILRHSFATHLINNNVPIEKVKEYLRHSNIANTQIYAHVKSEELRKTALEMFD